MDIALRFKRGTFESDISQSGTDLATDADLETAVVLSLFTNRRAAPDDLVEGNDRGGCWMDTYPPEGVEDDKMGSRLWLLSSEKTTQETVNRAREFVQEALAWLVEDSVAKTVTSDVERLDNYTIGISIQIYKPDGALLSLKYSHAWGQITNAV